MNASRLLAGIVAAGLLLTGCAASPVPSPSPTAVASETPTPTPTPEVPVASAVVMSLDSLTVVDQDGAGMQSVTYTEPDAMVALIAELTGEAAPAVRDFSVKGFMSYEWDGIACAAYSMNVFVTVNAAEIGGLPVRTAEGIHIGSSRADLAALGTFDPGYDADGDGASDEFGLEAREGPGNESLSYPGQPGTDFIGVWLTGDSVTRLRAPDSDYGDI